VVEGWVVEGVVAVEADMRELEVVMNNWRKRAGMWWLGIEGVWIVWAVILSKKESSGLGIWEGWDWNEHATESDEWKGMRDERVQNDGRVQIV
jgi:hypothetical protein